MATGNIAILVVIAIVAAAAGLLIAYFYGKRRGISEEARDAAAEDADATEAEGERNVEVARESAAEDYDAAAAAERERRESDTSSLGDYLDRHTGDG